ncbi:hypothetical protein ACWDBO_44920 [Streptomyces mirabilis]|uniref:hypothetical protein n=1 Tax=Streptomyces mirabilis TaxID=68239 RepID=UPI00332D8D0E
MSTDANENPADQPTAPSAAPRGSRRPTAQEVIQFVVEQKQLADLDIEVDYEALARLDDMPDDEAAALIDDTLGPILFS